MTQEQLIARIKLNEGTQMRIDDELNRANSQLHRLIKHVEDLAKEQGFRFKEGYSPHQSSVELIT